MTPVLAAWALAAVAALAAWSIAAAAAPRQRTARTLLTPGEIARALAVSTVRRDDVNAGFNEMTRVDVCNWYVRDDSPQGVEVRIWRPRVGEEGAGPLMFGLARGYATEHDHARSQQAHAVGGVGEEAVYAGAPDGSGGALAFRAGTSAATVTGSVSEETLVSLARLAAGRL